MIYMNNVSIWFKEKLARLLYRYNCCASLSLRNKGYLFEVGWFESLRRNAAIDREGNPIPWITYPCLGFLDERVKEDFVVFEFGSGNSTLWWARRAAKVVSCEHDPDWYAHVLARVPQNVELNHVPLDYGGLYSGHIKKYGQFFDVIFVDGRDRVNCVRNSVGALKPGGVIILDNSDVDDYREALDLMCNEGFRRIDFIGHGPISASVWRTSVFYRDENILMI